MLPFLLDISQSLDHVRLGIPLRSITLPDTQSPHTMSPLFINSTRELCFFRFEILVNQLLHDSSHLVQSHLESRSFLDGQFPLFVT
jgi:hypothetical protein